MPLSICPQTIPVRSQVCRSSSTATEVLGDCTMIMWSYANAYDLKNNLVTAALNGQCVSIFADTNFSANNGIDNEADLQGLAYNNVFYFFLHYMKALNEGATRSEAFFKAQQAYGNALIAASLDGMDYNANYQFNLYNLLAYHNFGVLEPDGAF